MAQIKITWTTVITETHETTVDYDELVKACEAHSWTAADGTRHEYTYPTLEDIRAGEIFVDDWANIGADFETADTDAGSSTDSRDIDYIEIVEP